MGPPDRLICKKNGLVFDFANKVLVLKVIGGVVEVEPEPVAFVIKANLWHWRKWELQIGHAYTCNKMVHRTFTNGKNVLER